MRKKVLLRQLQISWIPLCVAIIYAFIAYYSVEKDNRSIMTFVNYFSGTFFFLMWIVGQYLRTSKELSDSSNYATLQSGIQTVLSKLTEDEKQTKVKDEIKSNEVAEFIEAKKLSTPNQIEVSNYLQVEERVIKLFQEYKSTNFETLDNVRLENGLDIDILLKANSAEFSDRIIEIKYARKTLTYEIVRAGITKLNRCVEFYSKNHKRKVAPVLLVIFSNETGASERQLKELSQKAYSEASEYSALNRFSHNFIPDTGIEKFDIKSILSKKVAS
jgi:hypothetical protein